MSGLHFGERVGRAVKIFEGSYLPKVIMQGLSSSRGGTPSIELSCFYLFSQERLCLPLFYALHSPDIISAVPGRAVAGVRRAGLASEVVWSLVLVQRVRIPYKLSIPQP